MINEKQVAALKYLISHSKYGSTTAKQLFFFLLDKSKGLSKEVCVTLSADKEGYTSDEIVEIAKSTDGMFSSNCTTHLNEIMRMTGTDRLFSLHYGRFDDNGKFDTSGMFPGAPEHMVLDAKLIKKDVSVAYTFWLASEHYSRDAKSTTVTRDELEAIDLSRPGLYPEIEDQRRTA